MIKRETHRPVVSFDQACDAVLAMLEGIYEDPATFPDELNGATLCPVQVRVLRDTQGQVESETTVFKITERDHIPVEHPEYDLILLSA